MGYRTPNELIPPELTLSQLTYGRAGRVANGSSGKRVDLLTATSRHEVRANSYWQMFTVVATFRD